MRRRRGRARCASLRAARAPASLPPRHCLTPTMRIHGVAAAEDRGPGAGWRCGEGCILHASLLPEPAVHRPFLPAARPAAVSLASVRSPRRGVDPVGETRRRGFDLRRANRVKRVRANHTRCMCTRTVKRFRTKRARRCAPEARRMRDARRVVPENVVVVVVDSIAAHRGGTAPQRRRAPRRSISGAVGEVFAAARQPRRARGTTGRCAAPV